MVDAIALPEGPAEAPVLERERLSAGASFAGPAIPVRLDSTTPLATGWRAVVGPAGAGLLEQAG